MISIKKKEDIFFDLFAEYMSKIKCATDAFSDLVTDYNNVGAKAASLKCMETDCDIEGHKIFQELNAAFITPFDREDIYEITKALDNIVDILEETANRFEIFNVGAMRPEIFKINELIQQCVVELQKLFAVLHDFKKSSVIMEQIIEVNRLENVGDGVSRAALSRLFREEKDAIEIIKWKHIIELMEDCLDACENVANIVEGVVMKNA